MHPPPIIFRNQDTNNIPITSGTYTSHVEQEAVNVFNRSQEYDQHPYHNHHHHHQIQAQHQQPNQHQHQNLYHAQFHYNLQQQHLPVGNLIRNESPFRVDIPSINLGMSNEDGDSNHSGEVNDENSPLHSHGHTINDQIIDQHKDDDYANEQGEVIQESNAVPQLVSSDQSLSDNLNQIPNYTKSTTKHVHKDQRIPPITQTEANTLWNRYPSTTEQYSATIGTERPITNQTPIVSQPISPFRLPFGTQELKLQIPPVPPSLVNDMYAPSFNRSQGSKPTLPQTQIHGSSHVNRTPNNKQVFYGHPNQPIESRPTKFTNIGMPHHITLQNPPVPPHFAGPIFNEPHRVHHPVRPINVKPPHSRYPGPFNYNKPIPTNYSLHPIDPVKPNWHSSKPFDSNHFGPNGPISTTKHPTSIINDQTPQTSEIINSLSTQRPFAKPSIKPEDPEPKVTHYTDPTTNITHDLSRGKPFVFGVQRPPSRQPPSHLLNLGEEKRPIISEKPANDSNDEIQAGDIFDYKESNNPHNFVSITEPNQIVTTNNLPEITNAAFIPFGEKTKVSIPIVSSQPAYPKTPATEMRPPPTHSSKYSPYVEEVMGLHPPPIPKTPLKQKQPTDNRGNYGDVIAQNMHHVHTPNPNIYTITAPTHYPKVPSYVTAHKESFAFDISTEAVENNPPQIVTSTTEESIDLEHGDSRDDIQIPYLSVTREKFVTKESNMMPETTTTPASDSIDLNDYVHFSVDTHPQRPIDTTTRKPAKPQSFRRPSNGHMPQSPQFDEFALLHSNEHNLVDDDGQDGYSSSQVIYSTPLSTAKLIHPTPTVRAETVKATRHTIHDTKVLTVTTTRTTVRSHGITSTILLTLTRTKTSTIVDTITRTLVKPTRVTKEPTIKPTIFEAPVTMHAVSGSKASIVPNPSFSIYAIPHDESEHEHDSSNVSSEDHSFEIDMEDLHHMISPTPKIPDPTLTKHTTSSTNASNDSIFVVMTDKKLGTISINADLLNTLTNNGQTDGNNKTTIYDSEQSSGTKKKSQAGAIDDVSSEDEDDLPKRDEDDSTNVGSDRIIGGILIAAPPFSSIISKNNGAKGVKNHPPHHPVYDNIPADEIDEHLESQGAAIIEETRTTHEKNHVIAQLECQPDCKAINNEVCQVTGDLARCICRPGFARMFPDRPCKRNILSRKYNYKI